MASLFDAEAPAARPSGAYIVYQTNYVTVWRGDAREVLPTFAKESFALVLTDPPYGVDNESRRRGESFGTIDNDGAGDRGIVATVLGECVRLVEQGRHLYVFGPSDVLEGLKVSETAELIWDKGVLGSGNLASPWGPAHEPITFAVTKWRHAGETGKAALPVRLRKGSVLRFTRPTGRKVRHPNEKPVGLCRELIESSTRAGDLVLDPFAGSGSTGVAAILSGRHAVLVESDDRWLDIIVGRVGAASRIAEQIEGL